MSYSIFQRRVRAHAETGVRCAGGRASGSAGGRRAGRGRAGGQPDVCAYEGSHVA